MYNISGHLIVPIEKLNSVLVPIEKLNNVRTHVEKLNNLGILELINSSNFAFFSESPPFFSMLQTLLGNFFNCYRPSRVIFIIK